MVLIYLLLIEFRVTTQDAADMVQLLGVWQTLRSEHIEMGIEASQEVAITLMTF